MTEMNDLNNWNRQIIEEFRANGRRREQKAANLVSARWRICPKAVASTFSPGIGARQPIPIGITTWPRILM